QVALIEAHEVGENASGRNSGFAIDLPHTTGGAHDELAGSLRYIRLSRAAIAYHEAQVARFHIECDWSRRGKYHAAVSARGTADILKPFARELEALGEPLRWLDRRGLAAEIGTSYYDAAVWTPGCVLMNPAALNRGLAQSLPGNVTLYEHSPVTRADYSGGIELEAPGGSLAAPRMILAVNGLAGEFGFFTRRLLRFVAYASLTRPLTVAERQALGPDAEWGITPANAFVSTTMRLTRDHRFLIRHHILYAPKHDVSDAALATIRSDHYLVFRKRFPMLEQVTIEHTWAGFVCLSQNHAPGFGLVAPNVWAAVCQNAVGVTRGTIGGMLAADMACGQDNPLIADMEALGRPRKLPPQPFLDWGVRIRNRWDLWRARHEA
ncbi:MAG: FAD-binding oxidoreductase, partial [Pseudomonadota bacterium]|nr:FAD-binding oxidoreductase [Pseudomonadota bacterium]